MASKCNTTYVLILFLAIFLVLRSMNYKINLFSYFNKIKYNSETMHPASL